MSLRAEREPDQTPIHSCEMATISFVCALLSLIVFPIVLSPLAVVLGAVAYDADKRNSLALAGIAIGTISLSMFVLLSFAV